MDPTALSSNTGFVVLFSIYLAGMLGLALYGMFLNKEGSQANIYHKMRTTFFGDTGKETVVVSALIIGLSCYANVFSGYSLAGVSNEATSLGFYVVRWIGFTACALACFNLTLPRQRAAFQNRDYTSPTDLLADRFNSNMIRGVLSIVNLSNCITYTTAQFVALGQTIEAITHGRWGRDITMWLLMTFMFICEASGAMSSVMLTDSIQSLVMILAVTLFSLTLLSHYGPVSAFGPWDCESEEGNCIASMAYGVKYNNPGTGKAMINEQLDRTGDDELIGWFSEENMYWNFSGLDMFSFCCLSIGLLPSPHLVSRTMTTRNDSNLKKGFALLNMMGMVTQLPIMYVNLLAFCFLGAFFFEIGMPNFALSTHIPLRYLGWVNLHLGNGNPAFGNMIATMIRHEGWEEFIAVVYACGILAAIMSTADSTVLAFTNIFAIDWVVYSPFKKVRDWAKTSNLIWIKIPSLFIFVSATRFAIHLFDNLDVYGYLIFLNFGVSFVCGIPSYIALYCGSQIMCAPAVLAGMLVGAVVDLYCLFSFTNLEAKGTDAEWNQHAHLVGLAASVVVVVIAQLVMLKFFPEHVDDHSRKWDAIPTEVRNVWARVEGFGASEVVEVVAGVVTDGDVAASVVATATTITNANNEAVEDDFPKPLAPSSPLPLLKPEGPSRFDMKVFLEGVTEPKDTPLGKACLIGSVLLFVFSFPWWQSSFEALDSYPDCKIDTCGDKQDSIDGFPSWAWWIIVMNISSCILSTVGLLQWDSKYMPDSKRYSMSAKISPREGAYEAKTVELVTSASAEM